MPHLFKYCARKNSARRMRARDWREVVNGNKLPSRNCVLSFGQILHSPHINFDYGITLWQKRLQLFQGRRKRTLFVSSGHRQRCAAHCLQSEQLGGVQLQWSRKHQWNFGNHFAFVDEHINQCIWRIRRHSAHCSHHQIVHQFFFAQLELLCHIGKLHALTANEPRQHNQQAFNAFGGTARTSTRFTHSH